MDKDGSVCCIYVRSLVLYGYRRICVSENQIRQESHGRERNSGNHNLMDMGVSNSISAELSFHRKLRDLREVVVADRQVV